MASFVCIEVSVDAVLMLCGANRRPEIRMVTGCRALTGQDKNRDKERSSGSQQGEIRVCRRSSKFAPSAKPHHC